MDILITNDDGILAEGLTALRRALEPLGRVWVVAPEREQSGASHALTIHRPLRLRSLGERLFAVDGTPTDCVLLACRGVPELNGADIRIIVSGINHGANVGEDLHYSGTVAAAIEGRMLGRPAIAISQDDWRPGGFEEAGGVAAYLVRTLIERGCPPGTLLNVNVPAAAEGQIRGYRITRLGKRVYSERIVRKTDPCGRPYYWLGGEEPVRIGEPGSDIDALDHGYVSITPVRLDVTDHDAIDHLRSWGLTNGEPT